MASKDDDGHKRIAENRRARFDYHIEETWEAGIELTGTEVKSLRSGQANIAESYASAEQGGIFLINAYIPEYTKAGAFFQHDPRRRRRLLLHKREIHKLSVAVDRQGLTMVPQTPDEFRAYIVAETKKWAKVIKDAGVETNK